MQCRKILGFAGLSRPQALILRHISRVLGSTGTLLLYQRGQTRHLNHEFRLVGNAAVASVLVPNTLCGIVENKLICRILFLKCYGISKFLIINRKLSLFKN